MNINDIYDYIEKSIENFPKNITLNVELMEIKVYPVLVFTKIKDNTGTMKAIIYRNNYSQVLKTGDQMKINASLGLYRGDIELIIKSYKLEGIGKSISTYETLKNKLNELGYFNQKAKLENDYQKIGIVSSMNAAGMRDFLHTLEDRCCGKRIYIYPSTMQGDLAPNEIHKAISLANQHQKAELLVLIRGGGSKEDLECFNNEKVATAIFQSKIPIVTGIGHQIDTSLADLVSHKHYITPTAVAQNITLQNKIPKKIIENKFKSITQKIIHYLNSTHQYLFDKQTELEKYKNHLDNILDKKYKSINHQKICQYIEHSRELLNQMVISSLTQDYNNRILHLSNLIEKNGIQISKYSEELSNLSRPKIMSRGSEIMTLSDFKKNKTFTITFIDGSIKI